MEHQPRPQPQTAHSNGSKSGLHLPRLSHYHAHPTPQFAVNDHTENHKSNSGHNSGQNSGRNSGRSTPKLHYNTHQSPQFFAGGPHHDPHLTAEQNAEKLAKYNHDHAAQLELNRALHNGHADGTSSGRNSGRNSGRSTPKLNYHAHQAPQYFASGPHHEAHLSAEQVAEKLAKYNHDHAAQLALNKSLHGGHAEGDDYSPSRSAHHHAHLPQYHMHKSPQFYVPSHANDDKPRATA